MMSTEQSPTWLVGSPASTAAMSDAAPTQTGLISPLPPSPDCLVDESRSQPAAATPLAWHDFRNCFFSTFITIFLAELGDKTQVATLLMSAESHAPWVVFVGAAAALMTTSLVGVLVGRWLYRLLHPRALERVTGFILLTVSGLLVWDILH